MYANIRVRPTNSSFGSDSSQDPPIKQSDDDEKESIQKSSDEQIAPKINIIKKQQIEKLQQKKPQTKRKYSSQIEEDSEEQKQRKYKNKKINPSFLEMLDVQASSDSGQQQQSLNSEEIQEKRKNREKYQDIYRTDKKRPTQQLIDRLKDKSEQQINAHYKMRVQQQEQYEMQQDGDDYLRKDQELYQIKCNTGLQQTLVMRILNKVQYTSTHTSHYYCNIISAAAFPKKFPGYIFLEGHNYDDIKLSIDSFKELKKSTLKKIEFQVFTNLFNPIYKPIIEFKQHQYVKIKIGVYRDDLAQITKVHKNGVTVQVVPRVSFETIKKRFDEIDKLNEGKPIELISEPQKKKLKQEIFKKLTSHKTSYPEKERPVQKKLSVQDFYQYQEFPHNKNIKLTGEGLLLANYSFKEIQYPKTTIEPRQILQLNPKTQNPLQFIQNEASKVKLSFAVEANDLVQIIHGELKGCFGRVVQKLPKLIRIRCMNSELKDQIVDQIPEYLQKMFKQGQNVVVIQGKKKGEQGMVLKNGRFNVTILTTNDQKVVALKRNVKVLTIAGVNFKNDLGIKLHDIVKLDAPGSKQMGIVVTVKKNCVDYVNIKNQLKRAMNYQLRIISNYNSNCITSDKQEVRRNSIVMPKSGPKQGQPLAVKFAINHYVFLKDPDEVHLCGVWVEPIQNIKLHVKCAPRIQAEFLQRQPWHKQKRYEKNNYKPHPKNIVANSRFKVGNTYMITEGIYKNVRGVISAAYKSHIEVRVFNTKFYSVPREKLNENEEEDKESNFGTPIRNNENPVYRRSPIMQSSTPPRVGYLSNAELEQRF